MPRRTIPVMALWTVVCSMMTTTVVASPAMAAAIIGTATADAPGGISVGNLPGAITAAQGISIAGVKLRPPKGIRLGIPRR